MSYLTAMELKELTENPEQRRLLEAEYPEHIIRKLLALSKEEDSFIDAVMQEAKRLRKIHRQKLPEMIVFAYEYLLRRMGEKK